MRHFYFIKAASMPGVSVKLLTDEMFMRTFALSAGSNLRVIPITQKLISTCKADLSRYFTGNFVVSLKFEIGRKVRVINDVEAFNYSCSDGTFKVSTWKGEIIEIKAPDTMKLISSEIH